MEGRLPIRLLPPEAHGVFAASLIRVCPRWVTIARGPRTVGTDRPVVQLEYLCGPDPAIALDGAWDRVRALCAASRIEFDPDQWDVERPTIVGGS